MANRPTKSDPAVWAMNCLRELEARGDIVRVSDDGTGGAPVGSVHPPTPQWKYASVRRMSLFLEASLQQGTKWAVFEPNGPELWAQLRLNVGAFMQALFQHGAFQGTTPQQAYFVKCDADNNPQASVDEGIVNISVGFAPLYPAEFVVIPISQLLAGSDDPPGSG